MSKRMMTTNRARLVITLMQDKDVSIPLNRYHLGDLLDGNIKPTTPKGCPIVYSVWDHFLGEPIPLYVGYTEQIITKRLKQHISNKSLLGQLIVHQGDKAKTWVVLTGALNEMAQALGLELCDMWDTEMVLMSLFRPCLNREIDNPRPLPEHYCFVPRLVLTQEQLGALRWFFELAKDDPDRWWDAKQISGWTPWDNYANAKRRLLYNLHEKGILEMSHLGERYRLGHRYDMVISLLETSLTQEEVG